MLRCPPSRISLTSTDLHDFEQRFNARQAARVPHLHQPNLRLSPGPGHQSKLAIISEDHNVGRKRAASSASQATVCSAEDDAPSDLPVTLVTNSSGVWAVDTPTNVQSNAAEHTRLCNEAATALEHAARQYLSPQKPSPRPLPQPATGVQHRGARDEPTPAEQALRFTGSVLDGCVETRPAASPAHRRGEDADVPRSRRGLAILDEIHADAFLTSPPPRNELPPLSSARARRRHARSHDVNVAVDGPELQHLIQARHIQRLPSRGFHADIPHPVPELVLPESEWNSQPPPNPALDPGAPVFVPRIRFGTMASSSGEDDATVTAREPQWSSMDSTHSSSRLRLRSSAEQNVDPPFRHRVNASTQSNGTVQPAHRRRSRLSDQNAAVQQPVANLERYPLLRPPTRHGPQRRNSGSQRPVIMPGHRYSRAPSVASMHPAGTAVQQQMNPSAHTAAAALVQLDGPADYTLPVRTVPPALSSSSHSTPNLLHPVLSGPRAPSSSSPFFFGRVVMPAGHRIPSMVSAASGASSIVSSSRQSSTATMSDAATEFLQMRNSPLDDLTERLSRISASRPRSVGRSWERPPTRRARVSLLAGDPFRQELSPAPPSSPTPAAVQVLGVEEASHVAANIGRHARLPSDVTPLRQPLASLRQTTSPALPSTPPTGASNVSSPRQPPNQRSPAKVRDTPGSAVRRKPLPTVATTPKVRVYNDAEPPNTQPQTPADIGRSTRRRRGRSDTVVQQTPSGSRSLMASPPVVPERHPHRNTYPSRTPPQQTVEGTPSNATPAAVPSVSSIPPAHIPVRTRVQRGSDERENDPEGHVHGLEEDRRTWLSRRESGSLETTPPAEGRFERYLS
ncbi:hypothetical protein LTR85_011416 [Meristemomyces frigidus]|nr:hypothetical protein LTR85_011416 [Meristemomyces frigidus]